MIMKKTMTFILILLNLICTNTAFAKQNEDIIKNGQNLDNGRDMIQKSDNKLSIDAMKEDADFIVNWIKTHHPEVMKYGFSQEQKNTIDFVYKNINKNMSQNEFFFLINRLFAMLNDGHCILYYYPQTDLYLDIPFVWLEEGIIITKNTDNFKAGDKVLSIGNKSEYELITLINQQISSENVYWLRNNAYRILTSKAYLEHFGLVNDNNFVSIKILRGEKILDFDEKLKNTLTPNIKLPLVKNLNEWIDWYIEKENNLGYFRFDQWPQYGERYDELKKQLDNFFVEIFKNDIKNIAFDIRRNEGGISLILDDMLSYLKTDKIYLASYDEYGASVNKKDKLFDGSVYFLTSNQSFSCSVYASTILKDNKIVKTIGEPTGQKPAFNSHGESSDGKLPNTEWDFMMTSSLNTRPMGIKAEDSLYPDIAVNTTSYDILNLLDPQMYKLRQISNPLLKKNIVKKHVLVTQQESITIKNSDFFNIDMNNRTINLKFCESDIKNENIKFYTIEGNQKILMNVSYDNKNAVINIKNTSKIGQKYLLIIEAAGDIEFQIELIVVASNLRVVSNFYTKFGYVLFTFSDNMEEISVDKIKVYDENNQLTNLEGIEIVEDSNILLVNPSYKFISGKAYRIYIPRKAIKLKSGQYNNEDIYSDFIIK